MSLNIDAPVPLTLVLTSTDTTQNGSFAFDYTPYGAAISPEYSGLEAGFTTVTDPTTHQQYNITFTMDYVGLGYGGNSGTQAFSVQIPTQFFNLISTDFVEYSVTLYALDPNNNFAVTGQATETVDLFILGTASPPPPPPPKLSPEEKAQLQSNANTLDSLANALSDLGAATDPLNPELKLISSVASQLASAIDPQVGTVNSIAQTVLSVAANAIQESSGLNPIGITLTHLLQ
jgi:hypothetical protein